MGWDISDTTRESKDGRNLLGRVVNDREYVLELVWDQG